MLITGSVQKSNNKMRYKYIRLVTVRYTCTRRSSCSIHIMTLKTISIWLVVAASANNFATVSSQEDLNLSHLAKSNFTNSDGNPINSNGRNSSVTRCGNVINVITVCVPITGNASCPSSGYPSMTPSLSFVPGMPQQSYIQAPPTTCYQVASGYSNPTTSSSISTFQPFSSYS